MKKSIIILIPYFGRWPEWFSLFIETIKRNSTIDFLFYTDCDTSLLDAPNIKVRSLTFSDYVLFANQVTGLNFNPPNAYKLCDLRPLFGYIHRVDFKDYDFYGWCDVDLLFGDIRSFYTDELLAKYDVFSTHSHRISGHFALFRNNEKNQTMYRKIYRWKEALYHPEFVGIDEHGITNAYVQNILHKVNDKFNFGLPEKFLNKLSFYKIRKLYLKEQYTTPFIPRPWLDGTLNSQQPDTWYYINNKITNNRDVARNFIYIHFMNFKSSQWRHDGTKAPWEGKEKICFATPKDMDKGIIIDNYGIRPL